MGKRVYSIDAPNQRRLKVARMEIEAVLKKLDLAGVVVLHTPGMTEFFYDVRPSYSCAWLDEAAQMVRVKSLADHYAGDLRAQLHDQACTANLFRGLAQDLTSAAQMFSWAAMFVDSATKAQHTEPVQVADPLEGGRH